MKTKLTLCFAILMSISASLFSQGAAEALMFSQYRYEGTARSMAMANAFTSLGGDSYSISINPAASAVYRYSEFTITPSLNRESGSTNYLGDNYSEKWSRFGISNIAFIANFKPKYTNGSVKSYSFGVAVNKLNNFTSRHYSSGINTNSSWLGSLAESVTGIHNSNLDIADDWNPFFDFPGASWRSILAWNSNLLDPLPDSNTDYIGATENIFGDRIVLAGPIKQNFFRERKGNLSEIVFNMGANFSDRLFVGANIGIQSLYYTDFQRYSEEGINLSNFDSKFQKFDHIYRQNSNGVGINLKVGFIALPTDDLRIGGSISTPTWLYISDEWDEGIDARYSDGYKRDIISPLGQYDYRINSPFRWNLGASYIFGKIGLISIDYEGVDYSGAKIMTDSGDRHPFRDENEYISNNYKAVGNIRVGAEIRVNPTFALRGGYSYYQNPEKSIGYDTEYVSGGIGLSNKRGGFIDIAYQQRLTNTENYTLYSDYTNAVAPVGSLEKSGWKLLVTLGYRF